MKAAEDATRCPQIPRRCHHCAGPLSKDMVNPRPQIASSLLPMILLLPDGSRCLCGNPFVCFVYPLLPLLAVDRAGVFFWVGYLT